MDRKDLNPKGLRLVVLESDVGSKGTIKKIHVVRIKLRDGSVSKTACGIGGSMAFPFPFMWFVWNAKEAPICADCRAEVGDRIKHVWGM